MLVRIQRNNLLAKLGPQGLRYMPTEDPNAFLLPDNRLQPAERKWQKVFVALPWFVFACMVAAPFLLVRSNLPWLMRRSEESREQAARRAVPVIERVPDFTIVSFGQMPDVLERPFPTLLMLFDNAAFSSKLLLPLLRDLDRVLRAAGLHVSIAALDLTLEPSAPASFLWEYPRASSPHLQLILPRARDGEAGIVDYDGRWSATAIAETARSLVGPGAPRIPASELERLEAGLERLRDLLFEVAFVEDAVRWAAAAPSRSGSSWWRSTPRPKSVDPAVLASLEESLDLSSLEAATKSCEAAVEALRQGA